MRLLSGCQRTSKQEGYVDDDSDVIYSKVATAISACMLVTLTTPTAFPYSTRSSSYFEVALLSIVSLICYLLLNTVVVTLYKSILYDRNL